MIIKKVEDKIIQIIAKHSGDNYPSIIIGLSENGIVYSLDTNGLRWVKISNSPLIETQVNIEPPSSSSYNTF